LSVFRDLSSLLIYIILHVTLLLALPPFLSSIETSSRNSEVIHAGIYYPPSSLKAKLCVRGKGLLYDYCKTHDIPFDQKGKLIVATNEYQCHVDLPKIMQNAEQNNVHDLIQLSPQDVKGHFESDVICHGALFSPSTGVLDSHSYMVSLLADAENLGSTTIAFKSKVENISVGNDGTFEIKIRVVTNGNDDNDDNDDNDENDENDETMEISCDNVVNCAGLKASEISRTVFHSTTKQSSMLQNHNANAKINDSSIDVGNGGGVDGGVTCRQYFAKGNYYRLQGQKSPFRHLVYPVPEKGGLGVHATIDLGGYTRFGPDVEWIHPDILDSDEIDLSVDPNRAECFYDEVRKYWPGLHDHALVPDYCGIRPKLGHPLNTQGKPIYADFKIDGQENHGIRGFVDLGGIESPGLTASMAISELVKQMLH
jgi:L-2-hydroxyglutarate oxidase LhgO